LSDEGKQDVDARHRAGHDESMTKSAGIKRAGVSVSGAKLRQKNWREENKNRRLQGGESRHFAGLFSHRVKP
jgi:hypothetical protein